MAHFKGSEEDFNREREGMNIRMRQQFEFEEIKKKLKEESNRGLVTLNQQFSKADLTSVDNFKSETIGLVSADEFRRKRKKLLQNNQSEKKIDEKKTNFKNKIEEENRLLKNKIKNTLSFDPFQSEDEPTATNSKKLNFKKKKSLKNPNVDTSFLPDKERDKRDAELRSKLKRKWIEKQELIKNEKIEIIYVYWDGSGHRKKITVIFC
ncbi:Protein fam50a [Bonamia ostreae]|uniref:Protein fam50a n=1 Tax=Bonamia ostreae TaxID=126728 RepID=A0ABV2ANH9_9EUKA